MTFQTPLRVLLAALAYFASARIGYALAIPQGIAVIWPPSGIMLALLVMSDRDEWPTLLAGGIAGSMISDWLSGYSLGASSLAAAANTTESLAAALVLTWRLDRRLILTTLKGLARLLLACAVISNGLTAMLGATMLYFRFHGDFGHAWFVWWVGDGLGMIIVAPVVLAWLTALERFQKVEPRVLLEAIALFLCLATAAEATLSGHDSAVLDPGPYIVFPMLFWTAVRFGPLGAATGALVVATITLWNSGLGAGPLISSSGSGSGTALQIYVYLSVASVSALVTAAVLEERKKAEVRLVDTEQRYQHLFDSSPDPTWVIDVSSGVVLAVNEAAIRNYGYSREEFLALTVFDLRPADEPHSSSNAEWDPGTQVRGESSRHRCKDGSKVDVEISSHAITWDGRPARLVHAHDVTRRRRSDEALRETQERLRQVITSSGAVIYELRVHNGEITLEWISDNLPRILGYSVEEAKSPLWWSSNVHPEDRKRLNGRPGLASYLDGTSEYRFRDLEGRFRWLREEQRVTRDEQGELVSVVGAWLDITESRQLEQQMHQSQKMEAVGQLAGGIAHDFNNILTVILAESEEVLAHEGVTDPRSRASLEEVRSSAERAAALTRQLLTFSRRQIISPTSINLNEIVVGMEKMLRRLIGEQIHMTFFPALQLHRTVADKGQIEQVFLNLAVNARDAMSSGGVLTIETSNVHLDHHYLATHPGVLPGDYVMLAVSDTGTGMGEDVKAHLFEPFFTTKTPGKGTGLGLATCYAIARQFGGHIGVQSEPGQGTTMQVYFPAVESTVEETRPTPRARLRENRRETILLTEDESQVRRVTSRMLRRAGYVVHEMSSAEEALEFIEQRDEPFDLLLTDVVLPGIGGSELADRISLLRPGSRVLFTSGYADDNVLMNRLQARGAILLQKPFTAETLCEKVVQALRQGDGPEPTPASSVGERRTVPARSRADRPRTARSPD